MMLETILANQFLTGAACVFILLFSLWLVSLIIRDASIIDMFWGGGFALIAFATLLTSSNLSVYALATGGLVIIWGLRLFFHLLIRWRKEGEEDYRYQKMRAYHGDRFWWRSFFTVFTLQGVLMWVVALPYIAAFYIGGSAALPLLTVFGLLVALAGLSMETLADRQLTRFRATAKPGDLLTNGWWSRTRHPNYFGDVVFWYGIWIAVTAATPEAIWTVFSPLLMNYFLVRISGAAMLERRLIKKPGYEDYMKRTNRFIPRIF